MNISKLMKKLINFKSMKFDSKESKKLVIVISKKKN